MRVWADFLTFEVSVGRSGMQVKVEAYFDGEQWCAKALGACICSQGRSLDELMENVKEAVALHYEGEIDRDQPLSVLLIAETEVKCAREAPSG
jgi:hypothetical protein